MIIEGLILKKSVEITPLTHGDVEKTSTTGFKQGVNRSLKIFLEDGSTYLYKPQKHEHISSWRYVPPKTLYLREYASHLVDKALGFNLVPEVKIFKFGSKDIGSAQNWIDPAYHITEYQDNFPSIITEEDLWKAGIFDIIIGNCDRHGSNFIVQLFKQPTFFEFGNIEELNVDINNIHSKGYYKSGIIEIDGLQYNIKLVLIDHGFSFPNRLGLNSVILSRFADDIWNKEIPPSIISSIQKIYVDEKLRKDLAKLLDKESVSLFYDRIFNLTNFKRAFVRGYKPVRRIKSNEKKILRKSMDEEVDIYDYIDSKLELMPKLIEGKQARGVKTLGKSVEFKLYHDLKDMMEKYLSSLEPTTTKEDAIDGLISKLEEWKKKNASIISESVNNLYRLGFAAGVVDSGLGVKFDAIDRMAIEWLKSHPNGILPVLTKFSDDIRLKFANIIEEHYLMPGALDLRGMTNDMLKVTSTERWKLERIIRTSVATISNSGRLFAWSDDPYRNNYEYIWNAVPDNRAKPISIRRWKGNPYSYEEIEFLWYRQAEMIEGKVQNDVFNQRCTISRSPIDTELRQFRFAGSEGDYIETFLA